MNEETKEKQLTEIDKRLTGAIYQVIDRQIAENEPPETEKALDRLLKQGFTEDEAFGLIGKVVSSHIIDFLKRGEEFNMQNYRNALGNLPAPYASPKKIETETK